MRLIIAPYLNVILCMYIHRKGSIKLATNKRIHMANSSHLWGQERYHFVSKVQMYYLGNFGRKSYSHPLNPTLSRMWNGARYTCIHVKYHSKCNPWRTGADFARGGHYDPLPDKVGLRNYKFKRDDVVALIKYLPWFPSFPQGSW